MVLYVVKWDIHPDKVDAYMEWLKTAVPRTLAAPGVIEFRAFRGFAGAQQIIATYEFADMAAWAAWQMNEDSQKVWTELHTLALNVTAEIWAPSPVTPEPIRPGG